MLLRGPPEPADLQAEGAGAGARHQPRGLRGEDAFVERMKQARKEREEREHATDKLGSGAKWTGKVTKPKEFNFSSSNVRVKALTQPVSPMHR